MIERFGNEEMVKLKMGPKCSYRSEESTTFHWFVSRRIDTEADMKIFYLLKVLENIRGFLAVGVGKTINRLKKAWCKKFQVHKDRISLEDEERSAWRPEIVG